MDCFGAVGQQKISATTIGLIGLGRTNSIAAQILRLAGFNKYIGIDNDTIESSNLNGLLFASIKNIGKSKTTIFKREMKRFDSKINVIVINDKFQSKRAITALAHCDIWLSGVDNIKSKFDINVMAARLLIPLFDVGSAIYLDKNNNIEEMINRVGVYIPGVSSCLVCQGSLDLSRIETDLHRELREEAEREGYISGIKGDESSPGTIVTMNGIAANISVSMIIKYVTGLFKFPTTLFFDELNYEIITENFISKKDCKICGDNNIEGMGILTDYERELTMKYSKNKK